MTQRQSQVNLLNIKQFAQICLTTPRTLRFYEKKAVLRPYRVDSQNRYRFYHPDQVLDFDRVKLLQKLNLSLSEIRKLRRRKVEDFLKGELRKIKKDISETEKRYLFLKRIISFFWSEGNPKLRIKRIGPLQLFCFKIEKGNYIDINSYLRNLWQEAKKSKLKCQNRELLFYLDPYFKPKGTKLEVALICEGKMESLKEELPTNFYFRKLPKSEAYLYEYQGPYDHLALIYQRLDYYFLKKRIKIAPSVFEIYEKGPLNCQSPYDYLTKIYYPIS